MIRFQFPQGHPMARVAYTPDSLAVVTAQPHTGVFVRDRFSGQTVREYPLSNVADYGSLTPSPCGRFLGVHGKGAAHVFDLVFGGTAPIIRERCWAFAIVDQRLRCVCGGYSGQSVAECALAPPDGVILNPAGGLGSVAVSTSGTVIAMSPDGRAAVAVRQRGKPQLVELTTGRTVAELSSSLRRAAAGLSGFAVFSPNADRLALGDGNRIGIFDLSEFDWGTIPAQPRQLHPACELERPDPTQEGSAKDRKSEHWLPPLAFTPDGRHFLTLGLRERVQLYDAKSAEVAVQWGWRMEDVTSLAVAPDGLTACAGGRRGRLTVWDLC